MRDEDGKIDPRDAGRMRDLDNLRATLKNRLGRVIQRIKDGEIEPGPDCPHFYDHSQETIIKCLVNRRPIPPPEKLAMTPAGPVVVTSAPPQPRRQYSLNTAGTPFHFSTPKEGQTMTPRQRKAATVTGPIPVATPSAPAASKYCMHATPPPSKVPAPQPAPEAVHHAALDDNEPF
jgi:hypothetical protein